MNFLFQNFKNLPLNLIYLLGISFFYLFFSNLLLINHTFIIYLTPIFLFIYLKKNLKILNIELYLFIFGMVNDILSQKMLGTTSLFNLLIFYLFFPLYKKANNIQSFLYSIFILILYATYEAITYKYNLNIHHENVQLQEYKIYFFSFILNSLITVYIHLFQSTGKLKRLKVRKL